MSCREIPQAIPAVTALAGCNLKPTTLFALQHSWECDKKGISFEPGEINAFAQGRRFPSLVRSAGESR